MPLLARECHHSGDDLYRGALASLQQRDEGGGMKRIEAAARKVELILSGVDGVLTDGGILFDNQGIESKQFHNRDGIGIRLWRRAGYRFGVITERNSHIVKVRSVELGIQDVRQGIEDKLVAARELWQQLGLAPEQVCYVGVDLPDLATLRSVGFGVAVADAVPEVVKVADYVTQLPGGKGAVREAIEVILKARRQWDDLVERFA